MDAELIPQYQTWKTISFWTWLCAQGRCHVETVEGLPQTQSWKHIFV